MKKTIAKIICGCMATVMALCLVGCSSSNIKLASSQINALLEVNTFKSDMAVIDSTMAGYMLNQTSYSDLRIITLSDADESSEEYGVAGQSNNLQLIDEVNKRLVASFDNGTMQEVASDFGLTDRLMSSMTYTAIDYGTDSSFDKILDAGKIVIAYTVNPPMGMDEDMSDDGEVSGFDIELARAIFPELTIETKLIEWSSKEAELDAGKVDLVWNGLTITEERKGTMAISVAYMINEQSFVVHKDNVDKYTTVSDIADIRIAVEEGSAGESYIKQVLGL